MAISMTFAASIKRLLLEDFSVLYAYQPHVKLCNWTKLKQTYIESEFRNVS